MTYCLVYSDSTLVKIKEMEELISWNSSWIEKDNNKQISVKAIL